MEIRELNVALPRLQVNAPQGKQELPAQESFQRTLTQRSQVQSQMASRTQTAKSDKIEDEVKDSEERNAISEHDVKSKRRSSISEEGIEFAWLAMTAEPIRIESDDSIEVENPMETTLATDRIPDKENLIPIATAHRAPEPMQAEIDTPAWNHLELPKEPSVVIRIGQEDHRVLKAVDQVLEEIEINEWIGMPMAEAEIQQELKRLLIATANETRDSIESTPAPNLNAAVETPTERIPQQALREIANRLLSDVKLEVSAEDGAKLVMVPQDRMHFEQMIHPSSQIVQPVVRQIQPMLPIAIHRIPESRGVQIQLTPEHLGKVDLKLQLVQDAVRAEIRVENQVVKAAVEAGLADLKQSLSERGYEVREIQVQVSKDPHDGGGQAFYQSREGKREERNKKSDYLEILSRLEADEVTAAEL